MARAEIKKLSMQIAELKEASMFSAKAIAESAMNTALRILNDQEDRIERVERITKNMELLK